MRSGEVVGGSGTRPVVVTVTSTKGGVGKTTLTANLGGFLADRGHRVLMVDADVQPTLSSYYRIAARGDAGLVGLLTRGAGMAAVSETTERRLHVVVSDDPLGQLPAWILHTPDGRLRLRTALRTSVLPYDVILVDTQGAVGPLQDAAVLAADHLIAPIPPEILSAREFARGTLEMLERLRPMAAYGAPVGRLQGLLYRVDRTVDGRRIAAELRREAARAPAGTIEVLRTTIPATVAYREAATARMPVHRHEPRRRGAGPSGLDTMRSLVGELWPEWLYPDERTPGVLGWVPHTASA